MSLQTPCTTTNRRDDGSNWREERDELRRAYMLVQFGQFEEALEICRSVDDALDGAHHLPGTLEGAFLAARGDVGGAIGRLREVVDAFPEEPLPWLHFAEACFLDGRFEQASRAVEKGAARDDGRYDEFRRELEQSWSELEEADVPPPLEVEPANDES